jgi:hypothetical protein
MKKWVWGIVIGLVILAICCGIGVFVFYKFFQKATAPRSAYELIEVGQQRSDVEDRMGGSGLESQHSPKVDGIDCRSWVDRDSGKRSFEICFSNGVVTTKTEYQTSGN